MYNFIYLSHIQPVLDLHWECVKPETKISFGEHLFFSKTNFGTECAYPNAPNCKTLIFDNNHFLNIQEIANRGKFPKLKVLYMFSPPLQLFTCILKRQIK